jgi:glutathione-regulated potassium-efflux system ancillary protein KefC
MEQLFGIITVWFGLAILSAIIAYHLKISIALIEICVGVIAAAVADYLGMLDALGANQEWLKFLAAAGAVLLTFLAGAELDPDVVHKKLKEITVVGLMGFTAPFIGCALLAYYVIGWGFEASLLSGIAMSTTSMAVVYAVMIETGFNKTEFGKGILGACFINDLGTVIVLGLIFAPFTHKTVIFIVVTILAYFLLPYLTGLLTRIYANRTAAIRTKWVMLIVFGLGALALWSGSEAVLPAYLIGMALAGSAARDTVWIRRLRTLTVGFLTPVYFLRAGTLVSLNALLAAPLILVALLAGKVASKIFGLFPIISMFRKDRNERWYYTLLMSTGLTFGTISAMYGFSHGIVTQEQYSFLVTAVIASAVIPTMIAEFWFVPKHLLPKHPKPPVMKPQGSDLSEEG